MNHLIALALAHPGHGVVPSGGALHWLVEPAHLGALVLAIALGLVVAAAIRNLTVRS